MVPDAGGTGPGGPPGSPSSPLNHDAFAGAGCQGDALSSPPMLSGKSENSIYYTSKFINWVCKPLFKQIRCFSWCLHLETLRRGL